MKEVMVKCVLVPSILWVVVLFVVVVVFVPKHDSLWKSVDVNPYICGANYAVENKLVEHVSHGENMVLICPFANFTHKRICATVHYIHTDGQRITMVITNPPMGECATYVRPFASRDVVAGKRVVSIEKGKISGK